MLHLAQNVDEPPAVLRTGRHGMSAAAAVVAAAVLGIAAAPVNAQSPQFDSSFKDIGNVKHNGGCFATFRVSNVGTAPQPLRIKDIASTVAFPRHSYTTGPIARGDPPGEIKLYCDASKLGPFDERVKVTTNEPLGQPIVYYLRVKGNVVAVPKKPSSGKDQKGNPHWW